MNIDKANSLLDQLADYFNSVKPPSERNDLDDFALEQALELESDLQALIAKEETYVASRDCNQTVSATRDHMGI